MRIEELRQQAREYINCIEDEATLAKAIDVLHEVLPPVDPDAPASYNPDGTSLTHAELEALLDERSAAMRRGEGVLTHEEFNAKRAAFWSKYD